MSMTATVSFGSRKEADEFAVAFSRRTMLGHTVGAMKEGKCLVVVDVENNDVKEWIDSYVRKANKQNH